MNKTASRGHKTTGRLRDVAMSCSIVSEKYVLNFCFVSFHCAMASLNKLKTVKQSFAPQISQPYFSVSTLRFYSVQTAR